MCCICTPRLVSACQQLLHVALPCAKHDTPRTPDADPAQCGIASAAAQLSGCRAAHSQCPACKPPSGSSHQYNLAAASLTLRCAQCGPGGADHLYGAEPHEHPEPAHAPAVLCGDAAQQVCWGICMFTAFFLAQRPPSGSAYMACQTQSSAPGLAQRNRASRRLCSIGPEISARQTSLGSTLMKRLCTLLYGADGAHCQC